MASELARFTVTRNLPEDVRQRQIYVSLDGVPLRTLLFDQSFTHEFPAGSHRLRAYNTLVWKTLDFEAKPGEHIEFEVANRPGRWSFPFMTVLGVGPLYLTLRRRIGA